MADRRDVTLQVRITEKGAAEIDKRRGGWTRSEYARAALAHAVKAGVKGPDPF